MGTKTPITATSCASVRGTTRGIHGPTCTNTTSTIPSAAVLLDAPGNSIEDVTVQGFTDGVEIGANLNASGNVLANVAGAVTNVVHIKSAHAPTDVSIMGVGNGGSALHTIQDDLTSTTVSDSSVGIYAIGEAVTKTISGTTTTIGYSRFTPAQKCPPGLFKIQS